LSVFTAYCDHTETYRLLQLLCTSISIFHTHNNSTYWRRQKRFKFVLCNCALPDDWVVTAETYSSLRILEHYSDFNEVCAFVGLH